MFKPQAGVSVRACPADRYDERPQRLARAQEGPARASARQRIRAVGAAAREHRSSSISDSGMLAFTRADTRVRPACRRGGSPRVVARVAAGSRDLGMGAEPAIADVGTDRAVGTRRHGREPRDPATATAAATETAWLLELELAREPPRRRTCAARAARRPRVSRTTPSRARRTGGSASRSRRWRWRRVSCAPHQAGANRRPDRGAVGEDAGRAVYSTRRRESSFRAARRIEQRARIGEHGAAEAEIVGHEGQREANLGRGGPVGLAAERILTAAQVARTEAGTVEAADRLATLVEEVEQADVLAAPALDVAADGAADEGDLLGDRIVAAAFATDADVLHVAAERRRSPCARCSRPQSPFLLSRLS